MTYLYGGSGGGQIRTTNNASSLVQWLDNGNVGIGTTAPDSKLMIQGGNYNTSLKIKGGGSNEGIMFVDSGNGIDGYIYANADSIGFLDNTANWTIKCKLNDFIQFSTNGNTEHMRITSAGKVFIGDTTASDAQLRVKQSTNSSWALNRYFFFFNNFNL